MSIREKIKGMQTWKKVTILVVLVLVLAALIVGIVVYGCTNRHLTITTYLLWM